MNYEPISECVKSIQTWNPRNSGEDIPFQYIDLSSVDRLSKAISETSETLPSEAPSRARQLVATNDVLVATVRPNLNGVAVVTKEFDGATASTGFCVLRPKKKKLDHRYLFQWVKNPKFIQEMVKRSTGANYPAVSDKTVKSSRIPLPLLEEQKRIAAILDKADAIRRKRQEALALADTFLRSVFLKMFGDPATNPMQWEVKPFGSMCINHDSQRIPLKQSDRAEMQGTYPYYGASGIIDWIDRPIFSGKYLLVGEDGANLLARSTPIAFLAEGEFWVNNHAHVVSENMNTRLEYLMFHLNNIQIDKYVTGSAQPKLNKKSLDMIPIPCPPISLQNKFVEILNVRDSYSAKLREFHQTPLFSSLQQRAFRGDL